LTAPPAAPHRPPSPVQRYLESLHERFRDLDDGRVADYIPELGKADPKSFGICVATVDGHVYEVGDAHVPFTIQSTSKPFVYGLALEDVGRDTVLAKIGVEPTGDAFNEISLSPETGRPFNPMINAGAIASTSLVAGRSAEDRWDRILALFSMYAGRGLTMNESVYASERDTGHRNRAISYMLRNFDIVEEDPGPALDLYFRQCSIEVDCHDLSVMAATLATGGLNPKTGERVLDAKHVDEVLSVMTTCGMYDYAGEWVFRVGLPAKSGVAGGILAVLPGQLGIGVYSPPLDPQGNSVRGVAVCQQLSQDLELHFLRSPRASLGAIRSRLTLAGLRSKRVRPVVDQERLDQEGHRVVVYRLQGDLTFSGIERVVRRLSNEPDEVERVVIDLGRCFDIDRPASRILLESIRELAGRERWIALAGLRRHLRLERYLDEQSMDDGQRRWKRFEDVDRALEWCEDQILGHDLDALAAVEIPLADHQLAVGLDAAEIEHLAAIVERRDYDARTLVVRKGDRADALFLLVRGELSVLTDGPDGSLQRLSTIPPGMAFGELSLVDRGVRSASVLADRPATCLVLAREAFASLDETHPRLKIRLLENILRSTSRIVTRLSTELVQDGS